MREKWTRKNRLPRPLSSTEAATEAINKKMFRCSKKRAKRVREEFIPHSDRFRTSIVLASSAPSALHKEYLPWFIPRYPESNGLVRFKISNNWFGKKEHPKTGMFLPFINKIGLITPTFLGIWKCSYHDFFTTLVATIYKRLKHQMYKHFRKRQKTSDHDLYKIAFIYASEQDNSWFLRTYGILKNQPKALKNHLYYKFKQMDKPIRFLYAQMQQCISWVQSRSFSRGRVKSITSNFISESEILEFRFDNKYKYLSNLLSQLLKEFSTVGITFSSFLIASLSDFSNNERVRIFHGTSSKR